VSARIGAAKKHIPVAVFAIVEGRKAGMVVVEGREGVMTDLTCC